MRAHAIRGRGTNAKNWFWIRRDRNASVMIIVGTCLRKWAENLQRSSVQRVEVKNIFFNFFVFQLWGSEVAMTQSFHPRPRLPSSIEFINWTVRYNWLLLLCNQKSRASRFVLSRNTLFRCAFTLEPARRYATSFALVRPVRSCATSIHLNGWFLRSHHRSEVDHVDRTRTNGSPFVCR